MQKQAIPEEKRESHSKKHCYVFRDFLSIEEFDKKAMKDQTNRRIHCGHGFIFVVQWSVCIVTQ